jgi:choline dehydrogenase-like flavoprotein
MSDLIVIGSGPAGVSAAFALLKRGRKVTMLDGGVTLEPERRSIVEAMSRLEPGARTPDQIAAIKEGMESGLDGIPLKRLYGSDFPYRDVDKFVRLEYNGADITMSLARAGLSNVWGSVVLPFTDQDIDDWPIKVADLEPYYRDVFSFMPLAGREDDLSGVLPLYSDKLESLRLSRQAEFFLKDLDRAKESLSRKGITFGCSRLAVEAVGRGKHECDYCGLCLYGCPYDLIYSSAWTLDVLRQDPSFTYVPDVIVDRLSESADDVEIDARNRLTGEPLAFSGEKAFVGCGVISTTKLMLESLDAFDRPVVLKDSQYFLVPLLRLKGVSGVSKEQLHTLTQLCMELHDAKISNRDIHISVYSYSDLFESVVKNALGPLGRLDWLAQALLGRILVCGGYLHSDDSPSIEMKLTKGDPPTMTMTAVDNPRMRTIVRSVIRKLIVCSWDFKGFPAFPVARVGLPGRGYHAGGTFPMRHQPAEFESDSLGRPHGMRRVHMIDATGFPSIPATNITLTVMANACRVAELSQEE